MAILALGPAPCVAIGGVRRSGAGVVVYAGRVLQAPFDAERRQRRWIYRSHLGKTLDMSYGPRLHWLKEVDQAPTKSEIRRHKDQFHKQMAEVLQVPGVGDNVENRRQSPTEEQKTKSDRGTQHDVNEALRMYRLLRPNSPAFYEEDTLFNLKAKMNKTLLDNAPEAVQEQVGRGEIARRRDDPSFDPFKSYLPVVNQRAFLFALESVIASLADDVETMCELVGVKELPSQDDPLRFKVLIDKLFGRFKLYKNPERVEEFLDADWHVLRKIIPEELADRELVKDWLVRHLVRVQQNQQRHEPKIALHGNRFKNEGEVLYNFAEDFPYDDDPMSGHLADERNLDFPLENAAEYMKLFCGLLSKSDLARNQTQNTGAGGDMVDSIADVPSQFQDLVWDLEKIGLRNWLQMDLEDLERDLPKGKLAQFKFGEGPEDEGAIYLNEQDVETAKLMLKCAARDRADLSQFEAIDPHRLIHEAPAMSVAEEISQIPEHPFVADTILEGLVEQQRKSLSNSGEKSASTSEDDWKNKGGATIQDVYENELAFYRSTGPVDWQESEVDGKFTWKWRRPDNTFWDPRANVYIQERQGVDPTLNLKEMRQHLLNITRMNSMTKQGRASYFRAIVAVGNGKGVYGFGVGFGNVPKDARADAAVKALTNLDVIDLDPGRMLCFPVRGQEYKHVAKIVPRPIGKGVKANKKFLPLIYILGLDNCKVSFMHSKWFTKIRALKRALDGIMSRRTLANMTGKRHALLIAPGDHWVHWPDRWFDQTKKERTDTSERIKLMRKHALHFKNRGNLVTNANELRPGWDRKTRNRWANHVERWIDKRRDPYTP